MEKKKITLSQILADLDEGKTREEIGNKYELSKSEVKKMFKHPALKGKKPKKQVSFELIDDLPVDSDNEIRGDISFNEEVEVEETNKMFSSNSQEGFNE